MPCRCDRLQLDRLLCTPNLTQGPPPPRRSRPGRAAAGPGTLAQRPSGSKPPTVLAATAAPHPFPPWVLVPLARPGFTWSRCSRVAQHCLFPILPSSTNPTQQSAGQRSTSHVRAAALPVCPLAISPSSLCRCCRVVDSSWGRGLAFSRRRLQDQVPSQQERASAQAVRVEPLAH